MLLLLLTPPVVGRICLSYRWYYLLDLPSRQWRSGSSSSTFLQQLPTGGPIVPTITPFPITVFATPQGIYVHCHWRCGISSCPQSWLVRAQPDLWLANTTIITFYWMMFVPIVIYNNSSPTIVISVGEGFSPSAVYYLLLLDHYFFEYWLLFEYWYYTTIHHWLILVRLDLDVGFLSVVVILLYYCMWISERAEGELWPWFQFWFADPTEVSDGLFCQIFDIWTGCTKVC